MPSTVSYTHLDVYKRQTLLCRPDCAGLCPHCGTNLNDGACDCEEDRTDPRWDALREVAERLRREDGPS